MKLMQTNVVKSQYYTDLQGGLVKKDWTDKNTILLFNDFCDEHIRTSELSDYELIKRARKTYMPMMVFESFYPFGE